MVNSIGLIESKGLVALIEAADVILKNSPVKILGIKKLDNGLVSLAVSGNRDYVKAAIDSAVEAGRRVGEIYASTVIDDPGVELMTLFSDLFSFTKKAELSLEKTKVEKDSEAVVDINIDPDPDIFAPITKKVKQGSKREKSKPPTSFAWWMIPKWSASNQKTWGRSQPSGKGMGCVSAPAMLMR